MATFLFRTKGNADPKGKPRVYFTCHPEDFERYFNKVCEDIFATHDCAIYYTPDMTEEIADEDKATDIGQMNLFVVPITFKLLTKPNRAMDSDIAYAKEENIPILPLMMESNIDEFYSKPDKFDKLQYLNPYSSDLTEISYADKLKKYLESVLISDEMAQRIRAAFDAYIFLSYRKKDRRYANELMKMIHKHPEFRDIAIWYDEFLTPGKSFRENIDKALQNSKLFTLLVTPNLLEIVDGKPNFVMEEEYPAARGSGMPILPAEMVETDRSELCEKYECIPECSDPSDEAAFKKRLLDAIEKIAISENNDSPEHNFLIGLAYLEGIDVEVNRERGIELITSAAEGGLLEAMNKLFGMYKDGVGVRVDYTEALKWAERIYECLKENLGEKHPDTLNSLNNLAAAYGNLGYRARQFDLNEKAYDMYCKTLGEKHPDTLNSLNNLACSYGYLNNSKKELALQKKLYHLRRETLGEKHPDTLTSLHNLAYAYGRLNNHEKALELNKKSYKLFCETFGEERLDTVISLNNLALTYFNLEKYEEALKLYEKAHSLFCKNCGEEHPYTLILLSNLAQAYYQLKDPQKSKEGLELYEKVYELRSKILGEEHPDTLKSLTCFVYAYGNLADHSIKKKLELFKKGYDLSCKIRGEEHPDTLTFLHNLAFTYGQLQKNKEALELNEKVYDLRRKKLGEEHPDTLISLNNLAVTYGALRDYRKALDLMERVYTLRYKVVGERHPDTIDSLKNLLYLCNVCGNTKRAMMLMQKLMSPNRKKK